MRRIVIEGNLRDTGTEEKALVSDSGVMRNGWSMIPLVCDRTMLLLLPWNTVASWSSPYSQVRPLLGNSRMIRSTSLDTLEAITDAFLSVPLSRRSKDRCASRRARLTFSSSTLSARSLALAGFAIFPILIAASECSNSKAPKHQFVRIINGFAIFPILMAAFECSNRKAPKHQFVRIIYERHHRGASRPPCTQDTVSQTVSGIRGLFNSNETPAASWIYLIRGGWGLVVGRVRNEPRARAARAAASPRRGGEGGAEQRRRLPRPGPREGLEGPPRGPGEPLQLGGGGGPPPGLHPLPLCP